MLIQNREVTHPDVTLLVVAAEKELLSRYPDERITPVDPLARFVVAYQMGEPVGCGAVATVAPGVAELTRLWVRPASRRAGVGRRLLAGLERRAKADGHDTIILETGVRQPEAIALYEASGYHRIPPFGEYVGNPLSVCFEKKQA
ncbi:MAG: GNAT family N-acetyltransferase [Hamadaea sp.]|uniref:GNAT family N-acetyltransferase n=1 Tax=Hamadaea sp. TaxID=2024425 RepID=UPI0017DB2FAE|nr:GNAT family N-acetyltransferase [Hamadaea sp.]NUR46532.1 GNAT family N-acetyltransferase [Hamadaea sp.]NUR72113.1 GNAT family N-acetyltransferase [Hamadaea sp.]NUT22807.1 GNAT family N-acetyltransferase [Hamadaea sp.]